MCIGFLAAAEGRSECFHVQTLELLLKVRVGLVRNLWSSHSDGM